MDVEQRIRFPLMKETFSYDINSICTLPDQGAKQEL